MNLGNVRAVWWFEWRRALTLPRMAWWTVLAGFPVFIVSLIRLSLYNDPPREAWAAFLFALSPMLVTMLGTLLGAAPAVSAELERKSWIYLAVRPHGRTAVLLGKYLASVTWVLPAALLGLALAVPIAASGDTWRIGWAIARLVLLAAPAYGALYLLLGVIFPTRSMVIAVAYTLIFELIISFIPAMINKLTVQFRLRALLIEWAALPVGDARSFGAAALIGDAPAWHHVLWLLFHTATLLAAAVALIRWREFSSAAESDA